MKKLLITATLVAITTGCATAPTPTSKTSVTKKCDSIYAALDAHNRRVDPMFASCAERGVQCPTHTDLETAKVLVPAATSCMRVGYIPRGDLKQRVRESKRRSANMDRIVRRLEGRS